LNELRHSLDQQQNHIGDNVFNAFKRLEANIQVSLVGDIFKVGARDIGSIKLFGKTFLSVRTRLIK
jgi:hypothetical protein